MNSEWSKSESLGYQDQPRQNPMLMRLWIESSQPIVKGNSFSRYRKQGGYIYTLRDAPRYGNRFFFEGWGSGSSSVVPIFWRFPSAVRTACPAPIDGRVHAPTQCRDRHEMAGMQGHSLALSTIEREREPSLKPCPPPTTLKWIGGNACPALCALCLNPAVLLLESMQKYWKFPLIH